MKGYRLLYVISADNLIEYLLIYGIYGVDPYRYSSGTTQFMSAELKYAGYRGIYHSLADNSVIEYV
jgi:hypothetical protein